MNDSKSREEQATELYHLYWESYIQGDLETFSSTLDEAFEMIGTSESEVAHNKSEGIAFFKAQMGEVVGKVDMRNRQITTKSLGEMILVNENCDIYVLGEPEWSFYSRIRISTLLRETESGWKVIQQHGSLPDIRVQEGETIAIEKINRENLELRDAIKRRTIELEQKNRDLEIEAALERVRAVAMGMKKPEDLLDVCQVISNQLEEFGVDQIRNIQIAIINEKKGLYSCYQYFPSYQQTTIEETEYLKNPVEQEMVQQMLASRNGHFMGHMEGKALREFEAHRKEENHFPDPLIEESSELGYCFLSIGEGGLGITRYKAINPEELSLFKRFHQVFSLAYQRFVDIQKAEAQARKAQIEASLERVRAHTMGLRKSDELAQIISVIFEELQKLGLDPYECSIFFRNGNSREFTVWGKGTEEDPFLNNYQFFFVDHPILNAVLQDIEKKIPYREFAMEKEELKSYGDLIFSQTQFQHASQAYKDSFYALEKVFAGQAIFNHGFLEAVGMEPLPGDFPEVLQRFAQVIDLAYTRFLDLQRAEVQAREAQIEAALERVRSRTMGMQNSNELADLVSLVFKELNQLDFQLTSCIIWIHEPTSQTNTLWVASAELNQVAQPIHLRLFKHPFFHSIIQAWKTNDQQWIFTLEGEEKKSFENLFFSIEDKIPEALSHALTQPEKVVFSASFNQFGALEILETTPLTPEKFDILHRIGKVFNSSYTRFNDLKKAEVQAREAQIEVALERVRSRSMAMHSSSELAELSMELVKQVQNLGMANWFCAFNIDDGDPKGSLEWGSNGNMVFQAYRTPREGVFLKYYEAGKRGETLLVNEINEEECPAHYDYLCSLPGVGEQLLQIKAAGIPFPTYQIDHVAYFKYGYLLFITYEAVPQSHEIFIRFAKVFEQTYTRFLDLQKAEAQAIEAQIELSLEKIRSKVSSMQESSDLLDIMVSIRSEFVSLGHEANYFWYMRWLPEKYEKAMTSGDGTQVGMIMTLPRHIHGDIPLVSDWEKGDEPTLVFPMDVETAVVYVDKMITLGDFEKVDPHAPTLEDIRHIGGLTFIMARTSQGEIGYSLAGEVPNPPEESVKTLVRFAGVFDLAYKRFEDLKKAERDLIEIKKAKQKAESALVELKSAQAQLIQAEKMASLGELTAGIAHEIQNPLNFVNNFSEVSGELIEEAAQEIEKGDLEEIKFILQDLKDNLSKINHHGKRAGSIVKGMLEHSRKSEGKKELTDLNQLTDECLRLSFHGLRAKDKNFTADFKTDYDPHLPKLEVVSQDIGRVILNLINNAFYAVNEKATLRQAQGDSEYQPEVFVSTKKTEIGAEISVEDNGSGISDSIQDKIFQPFFTTKPTGSGTGLGLSLSYDIVKAHGGEFKVISEEGKGTEFSIFLPLSHS